MTNETPEPRDIGDLLAVPAEQRKDQDPDPGDLAAYDAHTAQWGGVEEVGNEPEGEYIDPAELQEDS